MRPGLPPAHAVTPLTGDLQRAVAARRARAGPVMPLVVSGPTVPAQQTTPVPETLVITRDELDRLRFRAAIQALYDAGGAITRSKVKGRTRRQPLTEPHRTPQRPHLDLTVGAGALFRQPAGGREPLGSPDTR